MRLCRHRCCMQPGEVSELSHHCGDSGPTELMRSIVFFTVQPEEEDDEAGILDTIAGTPYSSSDTTPGAAGEDEAEDDEWLNDDEEQGEGEDQEGEAGSTEGVYPYEEEDQQTTAAANPLAKG